MTQKNISEFNTYTKKKRKEAPLIITLTAIDYIPLGRALACTLSLNNTATSSGNKLSR